ncbi:TcaA 3rd/4th domain-containing protein [Bacillus salacetis]|uniref:TcaA 3rd/4th domain-containing protein n=1 Tax=Bacillus salacetis TaxID=2315464 RepID=UPI003B9F1C2A
MAVLAVLLTGGGVYGYYYVDDASSPSHTSGSFIEAVQNQDAAGAAAMLREERPGLNEGKVRELLTDLHSQPKVMEKALKNMKQQETALATGKPVSNPFLFELKKAPEKKWKLIDQYTIELLPVSFTLETDMDAQVFINGQEIPPSGTELRNSSDELPGEFKIKAIKKGDYGTFEVTEELMIWETSKEPIPLYFEEEYVTVTSNAKGAEVFLNGKLYGEIGDSDIKIGPVAEGETVTISGKYSYPWGYVLTEDIQVGSSESIDLTFPLNTTAIRAQVMEDVVSYNTSYIESITYVNSSLLKNVKGKQLQEMQKTIRNLQQRSITYGGRLDDMVFDGSSFSIEERNGTYIASINVEERYTSSWNDPSDSSAATFIPKKYYFTYYCEYDTSSNEWYVVDSKEHKSLNIKEPI